MTLLPAATRKESPADNLCDLFLRDVSSLLVTSRLIKRSLLALRPECAFSPEVTKTIDAVVALSDSGEPRLREPLLDAGAVLPVLADGTASAVVKEFIAGIPVKVAPAVLAAEVISSLRLLVQHIELRVMLAAEAAVLVGQTQVSRALLQWSAEWRACAKILRRIMVRVRAKAYVADLELASVAQPA